LAFKFLIDNLPIHHALLLWISLKIALWSKGWNERSQRWEVFCGETWIFNVWFLHILLDPWGRIHKAPKENFRFIFNYTSMKLYMPMKNNVFHKHEKFHWNSVIKIEIYGYMHLKFSLKFEIFPKELYKYGPRESIRGLVLMLGSCSRMLAHS